MRFKRLVGAMLIICVILILLGCFGKPILSSEQFSKTYVKPVIKQSVNETVNATPQISEYRHYTEEEKISVDLLGIGMMVIILVLFNILEVFYDPNRED